MSLSKKIDVEPLTDARWSKIESSLFEKLDAQVGEGAQLPPITETPEAIEDEATPRRSRWRVVAMGIAAVAATVAIVFGVQAWRAGAIGQQALNPSRIVTGPSDSHLALGESSLDVGPESTLVVSGDDERGVLIVLDRGKVSCEVAPRRGRPPFVVQAGGVRVRVIGTRFTVIREGDTARVEVAHGVVEVSARGTTTLVRDGETWPASTTAALAAPQPTDTATPPSVTATVSADDPSPRPTPKRPMPSAPVATGAPVAAFPSDTQSTPPQAPAPIVDPAPAPPSPRELFEQASKLEARDPSRAIAIYRQLASSGGAWGMNALFAQGRLEADRGNRGEARRLLTEYLSRFPRGPNAADARVLLERLK